MEKKKKVAVKRPKIDYNKHWQGMPEFHQPNAGPIKSVIVNFENKEDMLKFGKLVGQQITAKTRSIWYPKVVENGAQDKRYSDKKKK